MRAVFVGGWLSGVEVSVEDVEREYWNGQRSMDWSEERAMGMCVPRKELDAAPLVDGYLDPMWDGGMLRYETQDVYDLVSR